MQNLPFHHIRVLDFGQYVAGPAAAVILADQGAEVIRIDPPGGPRWKSPAADTLNRRKKSIVLNLKEPGDLEIGRRLVASADVLIENFRPGVMTRLGLSPQICRELNPSLVYTSLPGFASTDTEHADLPAWEAIIAAASGQFTDMGLNRILMGVNPSFSPVTLASAYAALLAASATASALLAREETGVGEHIEVPIAAALMEGLVYNSMRVENLPERYKSLREREIDRRRETGEPFDMSYEELQGYLDPFYRSYVCADGRPVYVVSSCHVKHAHRTLDAMGLLEELLELGLPELDDWYCPSSQWPKGVECALGLYPLSREWADIVSMRMIERFREKSSYEWEKLLGEAGAPVCAHQTTREWLNSRHARESSLVHEIDDPAVGRKRQAGPIAWLASTAQFAAAGEPAHTPDQDRAQILAELRQPPRRRESPTGRIPERGWLSGVRVLDMSNVIAGPMTGMTLARFGAEVIKLDPAKPTYDPWNTALVGLQIHRGKRSLLADVSGARGREVLNRLIGWADIIIFNGVERQLEPLGLDADSLKAANPRAILCLLDAWGGPTPGPRSGWLGYDDLVQAATGIMTRFGGSINTPEEHAHLGTIDVLTGFSATFAAITALYLRQKTGLADVARTSLAATGQLLQIPFTFDFDGREPFCEASGREAKGEGPMYRCYEASEGWFFLAAPQKGIEVLEGVPELRGVSGLSGREAEEWLSRRFRRRPTAFWTDRLRSINIGAVRMGTLAELRERHITSLPWNPHEAGGTYQFTRYPDHPAGCSVDLADPAAIRPANTLITVLPAARKFGADTREILYGLGYSPEELRELLDDDVVSEGWGSQYLPD